jgi:hypothetical protein
VRYEIVALVLPGGESAIGAEAHHPIRQRLAALGTLIICEPPLVPATVPGVVFRLRLLAVGGVPPAVFFAMLSAKPLIVG